MHDLIKKTFLARFSSDILGRLEDSAVLKNPGTQYDLCLTTDTYTVDPLFFPGGDIGKLSVCGTVNDLSVMGAKPLFITCAVISEEGLETSVLEKTAGSIAAAAKKAGVEVVTGDFKVVEKGKADKLFINTAGLGIRKKKRTMDRNLMRHTDKVIINGCIGEHELAVLSARKKFGIPSGIKSDCAPLNELIDEILKVSRRMRFMRDPTRGGLATTLNEAVEGLDVGIIIYEKYLPVSDRVGSMCEILGFDPLYLANEGKVLVVCPAEETDAVLSVMKRHPYGRRAVVIGEVVKEPAGKVVMETTIGSKRIIDMLSGTQLPRIC
jgi:hydrogenase expression/formation protein HypE